MALEHELCAKILSRAPALPPLCNPSLKESHRPSSTLVMLPLIPANPKPVPICIAVDHMQLSDAFHSSTNASPVNTTAIEAYFATIATATVATNFSEEKTVQTNTGPVIAISNGPTTLAVAPAIATTTTSATADTATSVNSKPPTEFPSEATDSINVAAMLCNQQLPQDLLVRPPVSTDKPLVTGTVDWFDAQKGYGFIKSASCDREIFAHQSQIMGTGYRRLLKGQTVEFILKSDCFRHSGSHGATNVVGKKIYLLDFVGSQVRRTRLVDSNNVFCFVMLSQVYFIARRWPDFAS